MNIGDRLKAARKHLGLSQATIAERTGIPLGTYKKYEGDERSPGSDALTALGKTGINLNWLLSGEGPMLLKDLQPDVQADVDIKRLSAVVAGVEQALAARNLELAPEKKARLVGVLYEYCKKTGTREGAVVDQFLELAT